MSNLEKPRDISSRMLPAAVALAIALRAAAMLIGSGRFQDPDNYLPLASSLAEGHGLAWNGRPTAYRPPLYPLILAPIVKVLGRRAVLGVAVFHLALGAGTVVLTALTARRWGLRDRRVLAAALVTACEPVLLWQSRFVMTETLGTFLLALALAATTAKGFRGSVLAGACLGLAGLCRPSLLPGAGLISAGALVAAPGGRRERIVRSLTLGLAIIAVLAPWALRNALVLGEPVWTTTHGGYTLALGNNEVYYRDVLNGSPGRVWTGDDQWHWWDEVNHATAGMTEPQADRFTRDRVVALALEQPATFLRACLDRELRFWSVAPAIAVYGPTVRLATALWTVPLWVALALGLCRPTFWRWPGLAAPLAILGLATVHAFYWTDVRMRAPIVPAIALVAASAALPFPVRTPPRIHAGLS
jgi:4-amino-4-deoxy-L-arabinose transferase-like glycosyltransferase